MFNYILYRIAQAIALALPLKLAYKIAIFVSDLRRYLAPADRKAVIGNLKAIFPDKSESEINRIAVKVFRNFAKYLVDFFRFNELDKEYIDKNIHLEGLHNFDQARAGGKGVVILTAHIGNWELGGVTIALSGYPLWVVVLPHKEKKVDKFFNSQRESKGIRLMPLGKAARTCFEVLKNGQMLALVGDRDFTQKAIVVDFFGKPTHLPEGPAAFSLKTGSKIVPGFMVRNNDDTFTLKIEKAVEFTPTGDKEKDLPALINQCKTIIEGWIRDYPDQWYMFRRFWIE